jgi:protein TonB
VAASGAVLVHALVIVALVGWSATRLETRAPDPLPVSIVFEPSRDAPREHVTAATSVPLALTMAVDPLREVQVVPLTIEVPAAEVAVSIAPPVADSGSLPARVADNEADLLANPVPVYPRESRARRETGTVYLRVLVTPTGAAAQVLVHRSSGHERLDRAALVAVRHWRFVPARRNGVAVSDWVVVPIVFTLQK